MLQYGLIRERGIMKKSACILLWSLLAGQPVLSAEIPEVLHIPNAGNKYPAWVAAERVLTPSGEVDPSIFSLSDQVIIGQLLHRAAQDGCIQVGREQADESTGPERRDRQTVASMAKSAGWVFRARVTARATGFNGGVPGTLLEIVPEETLKGPSDRSGAHYIFVPVGTFSVGGKKICKTDERYPALPEAGDRVLLFVDLFWRNEGRFLWAGGDSGIITIRKEGLVSLPKRYRAAESSLEGGGEGELLHRIRQALGKEN
jgi:hypothetical protein